MPNLLDVYARSSIVSLVTFIYVGYAFNNAGRPSGVPLEVVMIGVPIMYGLTGMLDFYITEKYKANYSLFLGAIVGIIFSLFGNLALDLPRTIFRFKNGNSVYLYAAVLYALIFRFILHPLHPKS
jgi:hypothetical protein